MATEAKEKEKPAEAQTNEELSEETEAEAKAPAPKAATKPSAPAPNNEKEFGPVTDTPTMNKTVEGGKYKGADGIVRDANGKAIAK